MLHANQESNRFKAKLNRSSKKRLKFKILSTSVIRGRELLAAPRVCGTEDGNSYHGFTQHCYSAPCRPLEEDVISVSEQRERGYTISTVFPQYHLPNECGLLLYEKGWSACVRVCPCVCVCVKGGGGDVTRMFASPV